MSFIVGSMAAAGIVLEQELRTYIHSKGTEEGRLTEHGVKAHAQ